jgi:hypothetical protein
MNGQKQNGSPAYASGARYQAGTQAIGLYATRVTVVSVGAYKMLPL